MSTDDFDSTETLDGTPLDGTTLDGSDVTGDTPGTGTTTAPATTGRTHRPGVRVGTVVWGLIVLLVGTGVLLVAAGYTIDVQLASIVLLIAAGVGLILGPLVQGVRRRSSEH